MKNKFWVKMSALTLSAAVVAGCGAFTGCNNSDGGNKIPEMQKIEDLSDDRYVNLYGRNYYNENLEGTTFINSASGFEFKFRGTAVYADICVIGSRDSMWSVFVDGETDSNARVLTFKETRGMFAKKTLAAAETLAQADFIAAEDTRVSVKLLNHFDIKKPLVSYHEHNRAAAGQAILERLLSGETCALVTDAGTPAISDPGQELVALCAENGVTVQAIPGCCAAIAALAVSGLDTRRFTFEGFLPSGKKERRAALEELTGEARTMVFHEAPHRLRQTLADMVELLGDRPAALCRELTKLHEDTVRTTLAQAAAFYRDNEPRGEYVLVVAGREKQNLPALTLEEGAARVLALRDGGMKLKEAVRRVADDTGLPRNALYDTALKA